jgi:prepilin-type N-terminal cleavage/methylation domain-containing protein
MMTSEIGNPSPRRRAGFTLVELLAVVAIMAIVMSILGYAVSNMGGSATQVAASQVASGLSLARQLAVSKNTETRFVIANLDGATGAALPQESFRHWTVVVSNRGGNTWTMAKEWEKLPVGVVFLNIATSAYNTINEDPIGAVVGQPFRPLLNTNIASGQEWSGFTSFGSFSVSAPSSSNSVAFSMVNAPAIGYKSTGEAVACTGGGGSAGFGINTGQCAAVRLAPGSSTANGEIILRSIRDYYYVETDKRGRIRARPPESYRQ